MPDHLRPTAPIAGDALLPGDPGRALALAQELHAAPKMSNHHRGLWGYYGETESGAPLTIQSTGIGAPSVAVVLTELAELGVRRAIRIGTCTAVSDGVEPGEVVLAERALAGDGVSRALGAGPHAKPGPGLHAALRAAAPGSRAVTVATADLYYGPPRLEAAALDGAAAVELGTAPLFALGEPLGVETASILVVVSGPGADSGSLDDERLAAAELEMGRAAARALGVS